MDPSPGPSITRKDIVDRCYSHLHNPTGDDEEELLLIRSRSRNASAYLLSPLRYVNFTNGEDFYAHLRWRLPQHTKSIPPDLAHHLGITRAEVSKATRSYPLSPMGHANLERDMTGSSIPRLTVPPKNTAKLVQSSGTASPAESDGTRRARVFGVGATARYSDDAHSIIMGPSSSAVSAPGMSGATISMLNNKKVAVKHQDSNTSPKDSSPLLSFTGLPLNAARRAAETRVKRPSSRTSVADLQKSTTASSKRRRGLRGSTLADTSMPIDGPSRNRFGFSGSSLQGSQNPQDPFEDPPKRIAGRSSLPEAPNPGDHPNKLPDRPSLPSTYGRTSLTDLQNTPEVSQKGSFDNTFVAPRKPPPIPARRPPRRITINPPTPTQTRAKHPAGIRRIIYHPHRSGQADATTPSPLMKELPPIPKGRFASQNPHRKVSGEERDQAGNSDLPKVDGVETGSGSHNNLKVVLNSPSPRVVAPTRIQRSNAGPARTKTHFLKAGSRKASTLVSNIFRRKSDKSEAINSQMNDVTLVEEAPAELAAIPAILPGARGGEADQERLDKEIAGIEKDLRSLIAAAQNMPSEGFREQITQLVTILGDVVLATRQGQSSTVRVRQLLDRLVMQELEMVVLAKDFIGSLQG